MIDKAKLLREYALFLKTCVNGDLPQKKADAAYEAFSTFMNHYSEYVEPVPRVRQTYTYVLMEISKDAYKEIQQNMLDAGYHHVFGEDGEIDMHGIAVICNNTEPTEQNDHET